MIIIATLEYNQPVGAAIVLTARHQSINRYHQEMREDERSAAR